MASFFVFFFFFSILFLHVESKEGGEQHNIQPLYALTYLCACSVQQ